MDAIEPVKPSGKAACVKLECEIEAPIPFVEACRRVGWFYDLWLRDPARALGFFSDDHGLVPLRRLFWPPLASRVSKTHVFAAPAGKFTRGSRVKAACQSASKRRFDSSTRHPEKRLFPGTIKEVCGDGTFLIAWDPWVEEEDDIRPGDELVPMSGDQPWTAIDEELAKTEVAHQVGPVTVAAFAVSCACWTFSPFWYVKFLMSDPCETYGLEPVEQTSECKFLAMWCFFATEETRCRVFAFLEDAGAIALVLITFAFFAALACFAPLLVKLSLRIVPSRARSVRRQIIALVLDNLLLRALPGLSGLKEFIAAVCFGSILASFFIIGLVVKDAGIIAFGIFVSGAFVLWTNVVFGETPGLRAIRQRRLLSIAESIRQRCKVDITAEELRTQLTQFLTHPHASHTVIVELPVVAILANGVDIGSREVADSIRISRFLVPRAYAELADRPNPNVPECIQRRDVIVDVFDDRVQVPGVNLRGEHWLEQDPKGRLAFPWHLALKEDTVSVVEQQLWECGMEPGVGLFSWRPEGQGRWAANEARDTSRFAELAAECATRQAALNAALYNVTTRLDFDDGKDGKDAVLSLLWAQADVNYVGDPIGGTTPLHMACWKGRREACKVLIEYGADVACESAYGTPLNMGKAFGHDALMDELEAFSRQA